MNEDAKFLALAEKIREIKDSLSSLSIVQAQISKMTGPQGPKGEKGLDGRDGRDGKEGVNGKDGKDGKNGEDGQDGISVVGAKIDFDGHLVLTLSDGSEIDCGQATNQEITTALVSLKQTHGSAFDRIDFNTTLPNPQHVEGLLFYDKNDHSLAYYNEDTEVTVNIGREQLVRVFNNTGSTVVDGTIVYIVGATAGWPTIQLATASTEVGSQGTLGLVTSHIENNNYGYVCVSGMVNGLNTSAYSPGTLLYLSSGLNGTWTNVEPLQPNYVVEVGVVVLSSATEGRIFVHVDKKAWFPSIEILDTSTSVVLPTTPTVFKPLTVAYNDGFTYNSSTGELTLLNTGSYSISISFNALPSASNKNIYFYAEVNTGSGWSPIRYSAKELELINQQETQVNVNLAEYFPKNTKLRFNIWGDATITLKTTDLPGTTAGTVTLPAYRFQMA